MCDLIREFIAKAVREFDLGDFAEVRKAEPVESLERRKVREHSSQRGNHPSK